MAERIRVLLVDDHAMFREGVRSLLEGEPDLEVVGEVEDGRQAVQTALTLAPDVVLMDITMPQLDGIEATRQIRSQNDAIKVLILTRHNNEACFSPPIGAGPPGSVLKRGGGVELMSPIRSTHEGHSY